MPAEEELSVTLTRAEWFTVRGILEQAAFRVVAQILFKMATQIDRPNGDDMAAVNDGRDRA